MFGVETEDMFSQLSSLMVEARRAYLGRRLWKQTNGVVQHGLLKGYFLGDDAHWRAEDNAAKLVGLYEQEVCQLLERVRDGRKTFIDLGAADGFYGIGLIATNAFERSICYEVNLRSQENLRKLALVHGVADRVEILGAVSPDFAAQLAHRGIDFADAVVLVDIEGHEFETLTRDCLHQLRKAHVIVEIHDFMVVEYGPRWYRELLERARECFDITEYRTGARDLSGIPLLADHWTDTDRWLLCSEGRAKLMSWLHLAPKEGI
jgi:hypothetical protein